LSLVRRKEEECMKKIKFVVGDYEYHVQGSLLEKDIVIIKDYLFDNFNGLLDTKSKRYGAIYAFRVHCEHLRDTVIPLFCYIGDKSYLGNRPSTYHEMARYLNTSMSYDVCAMSVRYKRGAKYYSFFCKSSEFFRKRY
jgi:hypothetical protein